MVKAGNRFFFQLFIYLFIYVLPAAETLRYNSDGAWVFMGLGRLHCCLCEENVGLSDGHIVKHARMGLSVRGR